MVTGTPSVRRCVEASKEKTGERCTRPTKKFGRAVGGVKKPQETQKAKALWKMKAAKEAGEEYYDPTHEDDMRGRNETRLALWEEHLKDPFVALDTAPEMCRKFVPEGLRPSDWWRERSTMADVGFLQSLWEKADLVDSVCSRTASMKWNVPGKYWPHGELFFFLILNEPATEQVGETFSPFFNADIRTSLFSADVSRSVRSSPCT